MPDNEKIIFASPSLAHVLSPVPAAGIMCGVGADEHTHLQAQADEITGVLVDHGYLGGAETLVEAVQEMAANAAELERARELLLADGRMRNDEDVPRAVQVLITLTADVREQLVDSGHLDWEATRAQADELETALRDALAEAGQLRQARQELAEMEKQSIDRGLRYFRERQYRVNVAAVASKVIRRAHAESHAGSVATCGTCARDWVVVQEASGIHAPGN